jgi:hypothetical protein
MWQSGFLLPRQHLNKSRVEQSGTCLFLLKRRGRGVLICEKYVPETVRNAKRNVWNTTSVGAGS